MVEVENLEHGFGGQTVLDVPSWRVGAGEHCLVVGRSGSGKSTLLHLLAGLAAPRGGEVRVAGQDLSALSPSGRDRFRGRSVGLLLQTFHLLDTLSVLDNVRLARRLAGLPEDRARCREVLEDLGVADLCPGPSLHPFARAGATGCPGPGGSQPAGGHPRRRADLEPRRRELRAGCGAHRGGGRPARRHPYRGDPRFTSAGPVRAKSLARRAGTRTGPVNALLLGLRTIRRRPLPAVLTVLLLMLGIATVVVLLLFERALENRLGRDARGIDLVVGAKGSGLQLVLSSVFHIDVPTGNVPLAELRDIARHPMVASVIPLSLGDAYRGFRIVGTTPAYVDHYAGRLSEGRIWDRSMEAVLGSRAARETGLRTGSSFIGAHGLEGDSGFHHDEDPYRVVGVLRETGTVLDRLILVNTASVWEVHAVHGAAAGAVPAAGELQDESGAYGLPPGDGEITVMLVRYRTPVAAISLPRAINSGTVLQAASPAQETARLFYLVGTGLDAFRAFAGVLIAASALSLFIALWHAMHEQRYDLAVMRTLGASRGRILRFVLVQGAVLGVAGTALGTALGHGAGWLLALWLERVRSLSLGALGWVPEEGLVAAGRGAHRPRRVRGPRRPRLPPRRRDRSPGTPLTRSPAGEDRAAVHVLRRRSRSGRRAGPRPVPVVPRSPASRPGTRPLRPGVHAGRHRPWPRTHAARRRRRASVGVSLGFERAPVGIETSSGAHQEDGNGEAGADHGPDDADGVDVHDRKG